jgi:formylglycine-generating enzyme required for sulfatase activity
VIGSRLGPYEVVAQIGAGGMGEVYRAKDTRLGRDVAIKVLPADFAADAERLKRFEREAKATAALSHPNILDVHDVGTHEGVPYLVEELLEGESLRERLARGPIPVREAVEIAVQVAHGLAAAHGKHIVHRDLKPANVFMTSEGTAKILDFGIAKLVESLPLGEADTLTHAPTGATELGRVLGTTAYMSPEQARGMPVDPRSDIFSFGVVLYEMLSGQRPFRGETATDTVAAILTQEPPPLPEGMPLALQGVVTQCLAKRPDQRFCSAHDLGLALEALSKGSLPERQEFGLAGTAVGRTFTAAAARVLSGIGDQFSWFRAKPLPKLLGALGAVAALALLVSSIVQHRRVVWARHEGLPELVRLADTQQYWPAFLLARQIDAVVPDDPTLRKLWPRVAGEFKRQVRPRGSAVFVKSKGGGIEGWVHLGDATETPLHAPLGSSVFRVEHAGLEPVEFAMTVREFSFAGRVHDTAPVVLARRGELPDGMVRVETPPEKIWFAADPDRFDFIQEGHIGSFLIDVHEVTNREYKRFVDAGGYQKREYWKEQFERDGKVLAWDEAMPLLRDATGRPGPAGWELGSYPDGKQDYPVTGVSWYEAAAYAAFVGKRLPSVYHWAVASVIVDSGDLVRGSNFAGALAPVGRFHGSLNFWGLYDIAGNASEWCSNASGHERFALGGACDGPAYMFWRAETNPPFDRNPTTGFRCIKPVAPDSQEAQLDRAVARKTPINLEQGKPFSEDTWRTWRGLLSYAKGPLDARVEWTDDSLPSWRMEKVSFAAAYANERVVAYLFLPTNVPPPWQAVVFWPGAYAALVSSSEDGRNTLDASYWSYLVKDGRAVLYPILKGTFERGGYPERVVEFSIDRCTLEAKDIFRSIDYLETRSDIQKDRIAFLGFSWGAVAGPPACAVEDRIKVAILLGAWLFDRETLGFAHRCSTPTQMVNGRFDEYAEGQAPLFHALAAPVDKKRHVVFDADHTLAGFEKEVIKVNLEWLDRFLGPVR